MTYLHVLYAVAVSVTLVATVTDFRTGLIPNWLTLPALVLGVVAHAIGSGGRGALFAGLGVLICGATPLLFHRLGAMGGGDVKLFAALGALVGPGMGLESELRKMCLMQGDDQHLESVKDEWWSPMPFGRRGEAKVSSLRRVDFNLRELVEEETKKAA